MDDSLFLILVGLSSCGLFIAVYGRKTLTHVFYYFNWRKENKRRVGLGYDKLPYGLKFKDEEEYKLENPLKKDNGR